MVSGTARTYEQLVVNVKLEGVLADLNDPQRVGLICMGLLGSLVSDGQGGRWITLEDNATFFGSEAFWILSRGSMTEGESCGI